MANILDNKSQLQTLLSTIARKGINGTVTSLNNKSGDVTTEITDLDVTVKTWTFELEDDTSVDKTMVFYSPKVSLISFTIDGTSYQAEDGMTWGQWVDSKYNNFKEYHFDSTGWNIITTDELSAISDSPNKWVVSSETITSNAAYILTGFFEWDE